MRALAIAALLATALSGCGIIYKVNVYQGNLLEARDVEQLKPGLNKRQVMALLGSPSVQDPFHKDRWDYVATVSRRGSDPEIKNLTLTFDGDQLADIGGDYFPEQDLELIRELYRQYGPNLPRDEKNKRRAQR
ncbi:outer membrane protein assembly factor BamE [Pseudomarimonas arenosa]|uniref:Outer membrane protein assembly factor BamE n=1 Tax=Pseudomarimonas arenosa TaxID=2774145 RepID=A0AAW3ZIK3_9GAMM|nr:outer membrane protein assembly factor BamE [Pseudomarimonas arenosa]MBD8524512.1 outer membrane protein assembly factor BamE [Pseudomarimonas arenosa]